MGVIDLKKFKMQKHYNHNDSDQMSAILGPAAKKVLPKNYHAQNMQKMRAKDAEMIKHRDE